jgi:hypothetical protein
MHARGKQRDGTRHGGERRKWRRMAVGARAVPPVRAAGRGLRLLRVEHDNFTGWVGVTGGTK